MKMKNISNLKIKNVGKKEETNPLKIVREFQKKYRSNIPIKRIEYTWNATSNSVAELKQKNYSLGSQSIL